MELYADATGCRVIEPAEDAVLLGAAMTAAVAAGLQPVAGRGRGRDEPQRRRARSPTRPSGPASTATTAPSC